MSNLYVYEFRSRNKDNKDVPNFKSRKLAILAYEKDEDKVRECFQKFVNAGLPGEKSRLYRTVNSRNEEKIRDALIIRLLQDKPSLTQMNRILSSVAMQVENRDENKWMFDFDVDDENLVSEFVDDVYYYADTDDVFLQKTPHGYAVVVGRRFDTRELMEKWKDHDIRLMKDCVLFLDIKEKEK